MYAVKKGHTESTFTPCFIKNVTGIACPSCGTTRAMIMLLQGNFRQSIMLNPLGLLSAMLLIVIPIWLILDLVTTKANLYNFFKASEKFVRNRYVAAILITLVAANWIWNIQKNL
jgi:hypothetical protein